MWNHYTLEMQIDRLVGGLPKHPEIIKRWQEARWPTGGDAVAGKTVDQATAETVEALGDQALSDGEVAGVWTGFAERDGSLCIEERQVKAMLKESANILRTLLPVRGKVIPLRSKLAERVFVSPHWISLGRAEADETVERPIHVMTRQGPRSALKRTDVCRDVKVTAELRVLDDGIISEATLRSILDHASVNGLGTDRSQGAGTFSWELTKHG